MSADRQTSVQPAAVLALFIALIALVLFDLLVPALIVSVLAIVVGARSAVRARRSGESHNVETTAIALGVIAFIWALVWMRIQGRGF